MIDLHRSCLAYAGLGGRVIARLLDAMHMRMALSVALFDNFVKV